MPDFKENTLAKVIDHNVREKIEFKEGNPIDFLAIYNQSHQIGKWEYILQKGEVSWSAEIYAIHGIARSTSPVDVQNAIQFYHPDDADALSKLMAQAVQLRTGFVHRLRLTRADGTLRIVEANAAPVVDETGKVTRLVGTFRDITSQTEYENIRRNQTDLLLRTVRSLPVAAALFDHGLRYVAWSRHWLTDFNLPEGTDLKGEAIGKALPDVSTVFASGIQVALRGTPVGRDNQRLERATGVSHVADWRMQPWHDGRGNVGGVLVMIHVKYTGMPRSNTRLQESQRIDDLSGTLKNLID